MSARCRSSRPYARTVRTPCMLLTRACDRRPIATRSCAYSGPERGRYQRSASTYIGSATMPAKPSRQSMPTIVAMLSATNSSDDTKLGTTSATALPITATSSPTRESRSPLPTRSIVGMGRRSARPTTCSRRPASAPSPSLAMRYDPSPVSAPATIAATVMTATTPTIVDAGAPSRTRSTRTPNT